MDTARKAMPHCLTLRLRRRGLIVLIITACRVVNAQDDAATSHDEFYWIGEENKASIIMLAEQGIVTKALAAKIAQSVTQVIAERAKPGAARPTDYLKIEKAMIKLAGPEVTRIHSGRSRQDMGQTSRRCHLRGAVLATYGQFIEARETLLQMANRNPNAILPFYTHGVQAQPTTLGHYIGGYLEALSRESDRYQQVWTRLNLSPFGGGAGATSSFPINRPRLAELLGFDGIVVNSFDSGHISIQDLGVELSSIAASGALTLSMFAADLTVQYANSTPWFRFPEEETGASSIMPQKRNPYLLERFHEHASVVTGKTVTYYLECNNVMSGLNDYKSGMPFEVTQASGDLYREFSKMLKALDFDPARALQEVNNDYSMTTELADTLQREAEVPFRVGHHFASDLVTYGRKEKLKPAQIPFKEAQQLFAAAAREFGIEGSLPLTEAQFRRALTPENMVQSAKPIGGPQRDEVSRMLAGERERLKADRAWLATTQAKLKEAAKKRDAGIAGLVGTPQ
jgi:argininosuccinate lyase